MATTPKDETATFAPDITFVRDIDGNVIQVPRVTASREIRVARVLGECVKALDASILAGVDVAQLTSDGVMRYIMPLLMEHAPEMIRDMAAAILERSPDEVGDRFELHALVDIITPFLPGQIKLIAKMVNLMGLRPALARSSSPVAPPTDGP